MGKNDKYGPKTDLNSLLQQTSSPLLQQPLEPTSMPASVMTDSDYLQQLNSYLDKQTVLLDRMERLEAFVKSQEERKQAFDDLYSKHIRTLFELSGTLAMNRDFILDAIDKLSGIQSKVDSVLSTGIDLSDDAMNTIRNVGSTISDELDRVLPDELSNAVADTIGKISGTADDVKNTVNDFKVWAKRIKVIFTGSIVWGVLATIFGITSIVRCSSAESDADEAHKKFEAVKPHMKHMENDQKIMIQFKKDNPKTWDKCWKLYKDDFLGTE